MITCFAVIYANYYPVEVDSLWSTREKAEARARELIDAGSSEWEVMEMKIQ